MRRTSGVNHIRLSSHPQPDPRREVDFHRPRLHRPPRSQDLDTLPFARLAAPDPPIPLLKRPQRQPFRLTELATAHPALAIPGDNLTPLHRTPLHLPIRIDLHTVLLL